MGPIELITALTTGLFGPKERVMIGYNSFEEACEQALWYNQNGLQVKVVRQDGVWYIIVVGR